MPKKCKSSGVTTTIVGKELFKRLSGACEALWLWMKI